MTTNDDPRARRAFCAAFEGMGVFSAGVAPNVHSRVVAYEKRFR
jgi:hypothetical protein